ncbi:hypothetical protein IMG5_113390 [Ichthyophthirius multifiliis]|uniref:Uncharacterized protein n=1 Tax=Ichthyophthirius multifiliis TaxID=5932 RepID=G0QTZ8_ICHMU|nr:hypothetical protein IMG5_113390 [Ichthyophthirius multifiliis]EGR31302.1 hypothetical protein IMG5_113390 [Ichthyophthirius multifiliis]|eukprot:XP_004034788.1 hypothetical protein IMG5_113390 [Ichthyophthirius multifiliis]
MNSQEQINYDYIALPHGQKRKPQYLPEKFAPQAIIRQQQKVDQAIQNGYKIDIPFLYQTEYKMENYKEVLKNVDNQIKINIDQLFQNESKELLECQAQKKFIIHRFYIDTLNLIKQGKFTVEELRCYLLVRSYIQYHFVINHYFVLLGITLSLVDDKKKYDQYQKISKIFGQYEETDLFYSENQVQKNKIVQDILLLLIKVWLFDKFEIKSNDFFATKEVNDKIQQLLSQIEQLCNEQNPQQQEQQKQEIEIIMTDQFLKVQITKKEFKKQILIYEVMNILFTISKA